LQILEDSGKILVIPVLWWAASYYPFKPCTYLPRFRRSHSFTENIEGVN
jgi:hypothetical protein